MGSPVVPYYPDQATCIGLRVSFKVSVSSEELEGVMVRNDAENPAVVIIQADDGRFFTHLDIFDWKQGDSVGIHHGEQPLNASLTAMRVGLDYRRLNT